MSEREPITAELRELMGGVEPRVDEDGVVTAKYVTPEAWGEFAHRCDAIDAVHAGLERENAELRERVAVLDNERGNMHETDAWKLGYDEGFANADDWLAQHEDAMAEHGWYRALCTDRKPMLLGDRMEWANGTFTIHELRFTEGGCTTWDSEHGYTVNADECHHHAPTVEDVLREMADRCYADEDEPRDRDAIVAEFAAKLRLAGDAS